MDILFRGGELSAYLQQRMAFAVSEVKAISAQRLNQESVDELCRGLLARHSLAAPLLRPDELSAHQPKDVTVDGAPGAEIVIVVPFEGDGALFKYRPSTFSIYPHGRIEGQELWLTYIVRQGEDINQMYKSELKRIGEYLSCVAADLQGYNASLYPELSAAVEARKSSITIADQVVKQLGIPIKPPKK